MPRPSSLEFENTVTNFLLLKFVSGYAYGVKELSLFPPKTGNAKPLLPSVSVYIGPETLPFTLENPTLYRGNFRPFAKGDKENEEEFKARVFKRPLRDDQGKLLPKVLRNLTMIVSSKQNQPFAERVLISSHLSTYQLLFIQDKFSQHIATTVLSQKDVVDALSLLVKERGILFGIKPGTVTPASQIAALKVEEKNVTLLFVALRKIQPEAADEWTVSTTEVMKAVQKFQFQGSIAICNQEDTQKLFSPSFDLLPLLDRQTSLFNKEQ